MDTHSNESADWILDVGDDEFEAAVIEASRLRPVAVDFWAPWCGPCRTLGPILERVTMQHAGAFTLVKVDIDQSPRAAARFDVRSVPAVLGFRDGELVASFVGAQPERDVRKFVAQLLPSEADLLFEEAAAFADAGDAAGAEEHLRRALDIDARHGASLLGMARLLAAQSEFDAALGFLEEIGFEAAEHAAGQSLAAELRVRAGSNAGALPELRAAAAASPEDLDAKLALGHALAGGGDTEAAVELFLECVQRDPSHANGAARLAMLDLFEVLGPEHELTGSWRRRLAGALYR